MSDDSPRVLVVEDDAPLRDLYGNALQDFGYDVRTARDGSAALQILRDGWVPCLIFLDLRMPGMDGWQLADQVRAEPGCADVKIVVVAAHLHIDREAERIGAVAWLQKPFDLNRLDHHARTLCT